MTGSLIKLLGRIMWWPVADFADILLWIVHLTVQEIADKMKAAGKYVRLVLYPDGVHGLKDKYQQETVKEMNNWFKEYGMIPPSQNP
ncbi:MAG: alpha/beta fold hydrolase [Paenibacillus sp.]|nr:alpha/beta fold hydrolase [Paenibacillus sp.]